MYLLGGGHHDVSTSHTAQRRSRSLPNPIIRGSALGEARLRLRCPGSKHVLCALPKSIAAPGSQVGSRSPSPLRTERASFPALRASVADAPRGTRQCSCVLWCIMNLTMTVWMEEDQIRPSVILVVAGPVMQCEGFPALDHLSADGTRSGLLVQDLRTKYRSCPQGLLSSTRRAQCRRRGQDGLTLRASAEQSGYQYG